MPAPQHASMSVPSVVCAVITVSDTRTVESDRSGQLIRQLLGASGHDPRSYEIVPDDPRVVEQAVRLLADGGGVQAILLNGGTGLSQRDQTFEAVAGLLDKRIDGFGELFRHLSYEDMGAAAMLSRAVAGVRGRCVIFSMPGSTKAVELAMTKLIIPELGHLVWLVAN